MLTMVKDNKGRDMVSMACFPIFDMTDVKQLRDALMEILELCVSYKETKDTANPFHLYLLTNLVKGLTEDIERSEKGGKA